MTTNLSRRGLIEAIICAPAIVRASSLMPIKAEKASMAYVVIEQFSLEAFGPPRVPSFTLVMGEEQHRIISAAAAKLGMEMPRVHISRPLPVIP